MNGLQSLLHHKIIAIVRGIPAESAEPAAEALWEGGIRLLEVTMNTPDVLGIISRWRERYDGRMWIGAGTVLDLGMAKEAVAAGAQFLISPNLDESVIDFGYGQGIDVWPGVLSPTEIVNAVKAGAKAVKIFPAGSVGARYIQEIAAPLNGIPFIATGGVNLENIGEFARCGAAAFGLGGSLLDQRLIREGKFEELAERAKRFTAAVQEG